MVELQKSGAQLNLESSFINCLLTSLGLPHYAFQADAIEAIQIKCAKNRDPCFDARMRTFLIEQAYKEAELRQVFYAQAFYVPEEKNDIASFMSYIKGVMMAADESSNPQYSLADMLKGSEDAVNQMSIREKSEFEASKLELKNNLFNEKAKTDPKDQEDRSDQHSDSNDQQSDGG